MCKAAKTGQGEAALISILAFSLVFHTIAFEHSRFTKIVFKNKASVALNPLVPLFGHLVACSARISADRQTDTHTHTHTHRASTVTLAAHAHQ